MNRIIHKRILLRILPAVCIALMMVAVWHSLTRAQQNAEPQFIRMNFQDADIKLIIKFIQDVTGATVIVDGDLKGTVTIASDTALPLDQAMEVLNSALSARGYTMVHAPNNVIRIVPLDQSKQTSVPTNIGTDYQSLPESEQIVTQVVPITHVDADKIRADLKALVGEHGEILHNEASNTVIITDTAANVRRIMQIISFLDREPARRMQIRVYTLDYAKAKDLAALIAQLPKSSGGVPAAAVSAMPSTDTPAPAPASASTKATTGTLEISGELTVLADERSNSLVIATAPQNFTAIEELIESLDGMLSQVLIEVMIIEASLDTDTKMGIEWTLLKQRTVSGDTHVGSASTDWNLANQTFGLKGSILESEGANKLLGFLLDNQERINILSTPMILTSDNKEATITVGSEVPYLKETRRSTGDTKDFVYEYRDVGIKLTVTPHINDERFVNLDVHQEIKKLGAQTLFDAFIIISREADATVVARDGQTIVLGGLMRDDETITRNSIPFLGDLPLIGKLFRSKDTVGEKTELLVFITPHVVTSQDEIDAITNKQKSRLNSIIDKHQKTIGEYEESGAPQQEK